MGNKLIIGHRSALTVYRAIGSGLIAPPDLFLDRTTPHECATQVSEFLDQGIVAGLLAKRPIDLISLGRSGRHLSASAVVHALCASLPPRSFVDLGNNLLVASPELTFLQFCQSMSSNRPQAPNPCYDDLASHLGAAGRLIACVEVCAELCGLYSIRPDGTGGIEQHHRFTTPEAIAAFLDQVRAPGIRLARKALKASPHCSASPRETAVFIMLTQGKPYGFQIETPDTNHPLFEASTDLSEWDWETEGQDRPRWFADFFWPGKRLRTGRRRRDTVLEYDSDEHHTREGGASDKRIRAQQDRRDGICARGDNYIRLTTQHTREFSQFFEKVEQLSACLRINPPDSSVDRRADEETLFDLLFDSTRASRIDRFDDSFLHPESML